MLQITIPAREWYDEEKEEFITTKEQTLQLEHSLMSLSKWESKWKKPFLDEAAEKTYEETLDYIRCMTITQNVDPLSYHAIDREMMETISKYIGDDMTATWITQKQGAQRRKASEVVTSELIYYWMVAHQIPFDPCQKWHLNRLIMLIQVCNEKNQSQTPMKKSDILRQNAQLNAARRKRLKSRG